MSWMEYSRQKWG
ncbi:hypothetical protein BMF94_4645 [Rhodotorula taiwanensis]|uniref:Uncharacterized protein n=1 Tax=Rhodotorula taiwanensis TaxID=741276 RepID=A0A2S5B6C6_9BASI|nr:hypothetical protein BMF94_4645 [Rhodotorula taiwanensis]